MAHRSQPRTRLALPSSEGLHQGSLAAPLKACLVLALLAGANQFAAAQPIPDESLGRESSVVELSEEVTPEEFWIRGGAGRGVNLFHSFQDFNVAAGQRVYFANPTDIEQIFSRVTGDSVSRIDGLLGVAGPADLFLLNPQGILFGPEARLDISGSFLGTTATDFDFGASQFFGVSAQGELPLLTSSIQPGLQFGSQGNNLASRISNNGDLVVGQDLHLDGQRLELNGQLQAGGDVTLRGRDQVEIHDSTTNPFIATAGGQLLVQGDRSLSISALSHSNSQLSSGADLILRSGNSINGDAQFRSGGSFRIQQLDESPGSFQSPNDPVIRAGGDVSFTDYRGSSLHVLAGGQVTADNITILGAAVGAVAEDFLRETVALSDGSSLAIDGSARPTVDIRAGVESSAIANALGTSGDSSGFSSAPADSGSPTSANITLGQVNLDAPDGQVFLTNQYQPNAALIGDIILGILRGDDGRGGRFTGSGANITVDAKQNFRILDRVDASSLTGNSGSIQLLAQGNIELDQSYLTSNNNGPFSPGNITVQTGDLTALNGSQIQISTAGLGDAGSAEITATGDVIFDGLLPFSDQPFPQFNTRGDRAGIDNRILSSGQSNAPSVRSGGIAILARNITLSNGAQFQARVDENAKGASGDIRLQARDLIAITGVSSEATSPGLENSSALITSIEFQGEGSTGDIILEGGRIEVLDGASLQSNTVGIGDAGNISITATDSLRVGGRGRGRDAFVQSKVNESGIGDGGDITISAPTVDLFDRARVLANSTPDNRDSGRGNAGSITVFAPQRLTLNNNAVLLTEADDNGSFAGDISIQTGVFELNRNSIIGSGADGRFEGSEGGGDVTIIASESALVFDRSGIFTNQSDDSFGNAGDILIQSPDIRLINDSNISSISDGNGDGGSITLQAEGGSIRIENDISIRANIEDEGLGKAGNILLNADSINIQGISTKVESRNRSVRGGQGGNITITGDRFTIPAGGTIATSVEPGAKGDSGNILVQVRELETDNFSFQSNSLGDGSAGDITIIATDSTNLQRGVVLTRVNPTGTGEAGNIILETQDLELGNGGRFVAGTEGDGPGGNITLKVPGKVLISGEAPPIANCTRTCESGFHSTVRETALADSLSRGGSITGLLGQLTITEGGRIDVSSRNLGPAGSIDLEVDSLDLSTGGQLSSSALSAGDGGDIRVVASDRISITDPDSGLLARTRNDGNAGQIEIQTPNLSIQNGGQVATAAEATARGNAGGVAIRSGQSNILDINLQGGTITAETLSSGDGGDLILTAPEAINIRGNGILTAQTSATGSAGNVRVMSDRLTLDQGTTLSTTATATANPPANEDGTKANIDLNANEMNLFGTVQVLSETQGNAQAGRLTLQPNGGQDLAINLRDASRVSASTSGSGDGGQLSILAPRSITISGEGRLSAETRGPGKAGAVEVQTQQFTLENQAELSTSTSGSGDGGNINVDASESVTIRNQAQLLAESTGDATGRSGEIAITTGRLELSNEAGITSRSNNSGDGGNIDLNASQPLLLRERSVIETDAGGSGNGGNIAITTPFLIGFGGANADIIANAVSGDGGRIEINTQRLLNFGIKDGESRGSLRNNRSNDISASSETGTSGTVSLDTINVDPSRGLSELPTDLTDPGDRIAQGCRASSGVNSFVASGRGGIPQGPDAPLRSGMADSGWITAGETIAQQQAAVAEPILAEVIAGEKVQQILEVQGWQRDSAGRLQLVVAPEQVGSQDDTASAKQVALNCKAEPVHATMPEHD